MRAWVALRTGFTFLFPPCSLQGLETASDDEVAAVEVRGSGSGLHWEIGCADCTIAGLTAGRFGTKAFMEAGTGGLRSQPRRACAQSRIGAVITPSFRRVDPPRR